MDPETPNEFAKSAGLLATTGGKLIDATVAFGTFISRYVGGPLEQSAGIVEDWLKFKRYERQLRLTRRVEEVTREMGFELPDRAIPLKVALPLFQAAIIEDDDSMQDRWVNLLIKAAYSETGPETRRVFVEILAQLDSLEASCLDTIYTLPYAASSRDGVITQHLPESADLAAKDGHTSPEPADDVCLALANLKRLGCISVGMTWGGKENFAIVNTTLLGRDFVAACRRPVRSGPTK